MTKFGGALLAALLATWGVACDNISVSTSGAGFTEDADDWHPPISETGPHPKAVVDEMVHEFGAMAVGERRSHTFVVKNEGEAPLILKKGPTTCKCTLSKLALDEIPPGESAEITLEWEAIDPTERYSHGGAIGTNDPENPEIRLKVEGSVQEIVTLTPAFSWNIGSLPDGKPAEITGTIQSVILDDFAIVEPIETSHEHLAATAKPLEPEQLQEMGAKSGYRITAVVKPGVPVGRFDEEFKLVAKFRGEERVFPIRVEGSRAGPFVILATPGVDWRPSAMGVRLGRFQRSEGKSASLMLLVSELGERELEIEQVEARPEFIKVSLQRDPDATLEMAGRKRYKLTFEVPPGSPPGTRLGDKVAKVKIRTNHPVASEMEFSLAFISD